MMPNDCRYTKTHEWVRPTEEGHFIVGITDHAQALLGDIVYVELPEVDQTLEANAECTVIESVKAAADAYAPLNGTVIAINEALVDQPELINQSAQEEGWIFKMKADQADQGETLMDAETYTQFIGENNA